MVSVLDGHDALLFDLDGTVYQGAEPIEGATQAVAAARAADVPIRFVTNNASKSPAAVALHLRAMGLPVEPPEVATSSQAAAALLAGQFARRTPVLIVGTDALASEVTDVGLTATRTYAPDVGAVVQGHSPSTTWHDLAEACVAIRSGAVWVACNVDPTLPTERGQLPGNGSMVAALRTATGAEPTVAGKPEPALFAQAAADAGARKPLVIGDRLDTDIAGATAAGFDAMLVLSGVTTPAGLLAAPPEQRPRYLAANVGDVVRPAGELAVGERPEWQVAATNDALVVNGDGDSDPIVLLRALCEPAWASGLQVVRPRSKAAARAAESLRLEVIDYR